MILYIVLIVGIIITLYFGELIILGNIISVILFIVVSHKYGMWKSLIASFVAAVLSYSICNDFATVLIVVQVPIILGIVISQLIYLDINISKRTVIIFIIYFLVVTINIMLYVIVVKNISFLDYYDIILSNIRNLFKYVQDNINADFNIMYVDLSKVMEKIPGSLISYCLVMSLIVPTISKMILSKIGCSLMSDKKFKNYYISNLFGAGYVLTMLITAILAKLYDFDSSFILTTLGIIGIVIIYINGLAIMYFFLNSIIGISPLISMGIILAMGILFEGLIPVLGFIEMILDLRSLDPYGFLQWRIIDKK